MMHIEDKVVTAGTYKGQSLSEVPQSVLLWWLYDTRMDKSIDVQAINDLLDELKNRINNMDWVFGLAR